MNKEQQKQYFLCLSFFLFAFLYASSNAIYLNPDADAYFLIENGRYIIENGIPKTNPWNITEGLYIIIQQPLCSLLNLQWWESAIRLFLMSFMLLVYLYSKICNCFLKLII